MKPTMGGKWMLAGQRSFGVRMMSGAWNVMRWAKLRAIAKVARLRWMMGILPNLRGFVTGTSIRWEVFFKREGLLFLGFLLWEFGCAAGKVGAGSMQALSLLFLKMAAVRKMTSSSGLFHFVTVAWPGWLVETRYLLL